MTRDIRTACDAHATAEARDARDPDAFHREWLHVMDTQHPHTPQETDMPNNQRRHREQMGVLDQIHDTLKDIAGNSAEQYAMLTEIRDRLPVVIEPADITEEPPAGSQVTDREGDVWEQVGAGWQVWDRTASMWGGRTGWGSSVGPRSHAPLRPTTDADRERVGLPVDPAPADVDPDEALAMVLRSASERLGDWGALHESTRDEYRDMARAAREHIEAERIDAEAKRDQWKADVRDAAIARADKAEADLARMTEERDGWRTKAQRIWNATHSWLATIEPDDGGSMKVTRGRRGALINTIDRHWWSELFFNLESPMRDTERAES